MKNQFEQAKSRNLHIQNTTGSACDPESVVGGMVSHFAGAGQVKTVYTLDDSSIVIITNLGTCDDTRVIKSGDSTHIEFKDTLRMHNVFLNTLHKNNQVITEA